MNSTTPDTIDNIRNILDELSSEDKKTIATMVFFQGLLLATAGLAIYKGIAG